MKENEPASGADALTVFAKRLAGVGEDHYFRKKVSRGVMTVVISGKEYSYPLMAGDLALALLKVEDEIGEVRCDLACTDLGSDKKHPRLKITVPFPDPKVMKDRRFLRKRLSETLGAERRMYQVSGRWNVKEWTYAFEMRE